MRKQRGNAAFTAVAVVAVLAFGMAAMSLDYNHKQRVNFVNSCTAKHGTIRDLSNRDMVLLCLDANGKLLATSSD